MSSHSHEVITFKRKQTGNGESKTDVVKAGVLTISILPLYIISCISTGFWLRAQHLEVNDRRAIGHCGQRPRRAAQ